MYIPLLKNQYCEEELTHRISALLVIAVWLVLLQLEFGVKLNCWKGFLAIGDERVGGTKRRGWWKTLVNCWTEIKWSFATFTNTVCTHLIFKNNILNLNFCQRPCLGWEAYYITSKRYCKMIFIIKCNAIFPLW